MNAKELGIRILKAAGQGALNGVVQVVEQELGNLGDTKSEQLHAIADKLASIDANKTGIDDILSIGFRLSAQLFELGERQEANSNALPPR